MDAAALLIFAVTGAGSIGFALWRAARAKDPAAQWPGIAPELELAYEPDPPRIAGAWKGRRLVLSSEDGAAVVKAALKGAPGLRLEAGPKAELEKAAGMVVPDRLSFDEDQAFSERFLVRSTPKEAGRRALGEAARRKALSFARFHLLALPEELRISAAVPTSAEQASELLDFAVSIAAILEE